MNISLIPPVVWQSLHLEWLWVYRGPVPREEEWSDEITVPAGWFWVESGVVKIHADGREICLRPGQSFFSAPGNRRQWFAQGTQLLSVGLRSDWPAGTPLFKAGLNLRLSTKASLPLKAATEALFAEVHPGRQTVVYREAVVPVSRSLADWSRVEAAFSRWFCTYLQELKKLRVSLQPGELTGSQLSGVLKKLESWPLGQPLKLSRLAAGSRWNERRLHDLLRDHLGMTAQTWLERRRVECARQKLLSEDSALKEIAFQLGFRHPPHFTAWFKRHTGMTPLAFRTLGGPGGA